MSSRDQERERDQQRGRDQEAHGPRRAEEQDGTAPERPIRPDEEVGESIDQLEEPPQAEGERDSR